MRRHLFLCAAVVCAAAVTACSYTKVPKSSSTSAKSNGVEAKEPGAEGSYPQLPPYRINIGDVLGVSVWRAKGMDVERDVIVRPDGVISYPLVGDIHAIGKTLTELDAELTRALRTYIKNPEVSMAIKRFGGTKVIVLGEVRSPGVYSPTGQGSVLEVIALAGGFTDDGVRSDTILVHGGLANPQPVRLNLAHAILKGDQSQNPPLQPNDIVFVPKNAAASFNYYMKQLTPTLQNLLLGTSVWADLTNQTVH